MRYLLLMVSFLLAGSVVAAEPSNIIKGSLFIAGLDEHHLYSKEEFIFLLRLVIACILGCLIGLAHGKSRKNVSVSVRTYGAVCLGAAVFSSIFVHIYLVTGMGNPLQNLGSITTGVGFLCGAVIFKEGLTVKGLTTATTIWATAAIGAASGCGLFGIAIVTAGLLVIFHLTSMLFSSLPHEE